LSVIWPPLASPEALLPPLVRIDHVLTGPDVAVTTMHGDVGVGSDHRDLLATVAFRQK
jgi:endonuclease/exonuclease/phosphatase family metal-dependent hydrolase